MSRCCCCCNWYIARYHAGLRYVQCRNDGQWRHQAVGTGGTRWSRQAVIAGQYKWKAGQYFNSTTGLKKRLYHGDPWPDLFPTPTAELWRCYTRGRQVKWPRRRTGRGPRLISWTHTPTAGSGWVVEHQRSWSPGQTLRPGSILHVDTQWTPSTPVTMSREATGSFVACCFDIVAGVDGAPAS